MIFSIITPSYNQARFLEQTIQSVINQPVPEKQIIVIDGGSADESTSLIEKYTSHIHYWVSEKDYGQSHAINKGIKRATGGIINWLNSDDFYEHDALEIVKQNFSESMTGLGGRSRLFNRKGTLSYSRGTDLFIGNVAKTIGWARIDQPETFFSKSAWDKVGMLNENLHYCMDREWWMRYLYHFGLDSFKKIDNVIVNFRIHEDSKTSIAQPEFLKEHHSLFYAIARVLENRKAMKWMEDNIEINIKLPTEILNWNPSPVVKEAFQYYLLKSAEEAYAQSRFSIASGFIGLVDIALIEDEVNLYKKLKYRIPFGSVIKLLRK